MGRITVVHTADMHLGAPCKGVPPHIGRQRRKDLMQTLARISEICREQQTDLLLISGDLWDDKYITRPLVDYVADQFRRIPATRVVIAPGRTDSMLKDSFYREYPWSDNVHIFQQYELSSIWIPHLNTRIFGRAWAEGQAAAPSDWRQVADNSGGCQVLIVAHGDPDTLAIPQDILAMENLAYVALGGAHKNVAWSEKVLDPGCPEPLGFASSGAHGILQGSVGTVSGSLEFVALNSRQFHTIPVNTDNCSCEEEVARCVRQAVDSLAPEKNLFQVALQGRGRWNLNTVEDFLRDIFYVALTDKTDGNYDVNALETEHNKGVVGKYIAAIKQTRCNEEICKRALNLGLDALLSGRVAPW